MRARACVCMHACMCVCVCVCVCVCARARSRMCFTKKKYASIWLNSTSMHLPVMPVTGEPKECEMGGCEALLGVWSVGVSGQCYHQDAGVRVGKTSHKKFMIQVSRCTHCLRVKPWTQETCESVRGSRRRRTLPCNRLDKWLTLFKSLYPRWAFSSLREHC